MDSTGTCYLILPGQPRPDTRISQRSLKTFTAGANGEVILGAEVFGFSYRTCNSFRVRSRRRVQGSSSEIGSSSGSSSSGSGRPSGST